MTQRFAWLVFFYLVVSCSNKRPEQDDELSRRDFRLATLEGKPISDETLNGKILILNIWATWCKPCIDEIPDLVKLGEKLPEDYILLVASNEAPKKIDRFIDRYGFDLEFIRLKSDPEALGVDLFPTTYIFNEKGKLIEIVKGTRDWDSEEMIQFLERVL